MPDYPRPETFGQYDRHASFTDRLQGRRALALAVHGLFGEVGSILSDVKKHQRDALAFTDYRDVVVEELGDALWYVASVARHAGLSLVQVAQKLPPTRLPSKRENHDVGFDELYCLDVSETYEEDADYDEALSTLAAKTGFLAATYRWASNLYEVRDQLAEVLAALIDVSHYSAIRVEELAASNLKKALARWPTQEFRSFPRDFDLGFPEFERLPDHLSVSIRSVAASNGKVFVYQTCNGLNVGDRLTDNIAESDYYRFHDVFHYAYGAVLHWSPVLRALLKVKRKSEDRVDEAQDGARAAIVEEGISAYVFSRAKRQDFFDGVVAGQLSFDLLKTVRDFASGFEVAECPLWLWEEAILQGYQAFRFLRENGSGELRFNKPDRQIEITHLL